MLHVICGTLVLTALMAESLVFRHWAQGHESILQAVAAAPLRSGSIARN